jgi:hypothetical protein
MSATNVMDRHPPDLSTPIHELKKELRKEYQQFFTTLKLPGTIKTIIMRSEKSFGFAQIDVSIPIPSPNPCTSKGTPLVD